MRKHNEIQYVSFIVKSFFDSITSITYIWDEINDTEGIIVNHASVSEEIQMEWTAL